MEHLAADIAVLLCLLFGNILFGSIPSVVSRAVGFHSSTDDERWSRRLRWTTFLLYTGAGMFLSNGFLVLLPQANADFGNHENHSDEASSYLHPMNSPAESPTHHHDSFPLPEFVVLCGFFFAFVLQESVYFLLSKFSKTAREARDRQVRFCSCAKRHTECSRAFKDARPDQTLFGLEKKLMESVSSPSPAGVASNVLPDVEVTPKSDLLRSSVISHAIPNYGAVTNVTEAALDAPLPVLTPGLPVLTPPVVLADERRILIEHHALTRDPNKFLISCMLIVLELSLQYIFLGIHLGIRTEYAGKWFNVSLVCLQNFLLTFSAGSYLAAGNMDLSYVGLFISLLSVVSPIGMIAAMVNKDSIEGIPYLAKGIVSSVACGALLYTTFYDFLRLKCSASVKGLVKFIAILLGASIMAAVHYGRLTVL